MSPYSNARRRVIASWLTKMPMPINTIAGLNSAQLTSSAVLVFMLMSGSLATRTISSVPSIKLARNAYMNPRLIYNVLARAVTLPDRIISQRPSSSLPRSSFVTAIKPHTAMMSDINATTRYTIYPCTPSDKLSAEPYKMPSDGTLLISAAKRSWAVLSG